MGVRHRFRARWCVLNIGSTWGKGTKTYWELTISKTSHWIFLFLCFITLSLKILQGGYNCPHVKNKNWKKNEENLNLLQKVGSLSEIPAGLCFAPPVLFWWKGRCPDFAWLASVRHLLNTNSLALESDLSCRKLKPPLCTHQLLSTASFWVCAHFILRKYFVVYVLIAYYAFIFKVQAYEDRDLKYLIHFFISRA